MECLLPYLSMVTVPHIMVGLERMLDYRGVGLDRFNCSNYSCDIIMITIIIMELVFYIYSYYDNSISHISCSSHS